MLSKWMDDRRFLVTFRAVGLPPVPQVQGAGVGAGVAVVALVVGVGVVVVGFLVGLVIKEKLKNFLELTDTDTYIKGFTIDCSKV